MGTLTLHPPSALPLHFLAGEHGLVKSHTTSGASEQGGRAAFLEGGIRG